MTDRPAAVAAGVRARRWALVIAVTTGFLVWNVIFDLWLGQGERQYLWERAKHELGRGPAVSLEGSMLSSMRDAVWVATAWALVVAGAVLAAAFLSFRFGVRGAAESGVEARR